MAFVTFQAEGFKARFNAVGGAFTQLQWNGGRGAVPLLREAASNATAGMSSAFPMVPFANRVRGNRFTVRGREYRLEPNTVGDPHHCHGDGWLGDWTVLEQGADHLTLGYTHLPIEPVPYRYEASQNFRVAGNRLTATFAVTNLGSSPMPFGLGWHPYFPLTPRTTLEASAERMWTEDEGWLPGRPTTIPADLRFHAPREMPRRWLNNGFENWSGMARIVWPEREAALEIQADQKFRHFFLFMPDEIFDSNYAQDYFAFEPMTHLADGHNMTDGGGLVMLSPGETLRASLCLQPSLAPSQKDAP
jgi:aldose 1-epimerase